MEKLDLDFELKDIGPAGEFEGWASTYDLDLGNDKVLPDAFKATLRKHKGQVPVLFNHDRSKIIGVGTDAREDHKGLYVKAKLAMNTQLGRETHELMSMGALKGLSIGFTIPDKGGWVMDGRTRLLKSVHLMEYSATPFPLNSEAQVTRVKSVDDMTARQFEETLREVGFSKKDALCIMSKGFNQLLKERREAGSDSGELPEEAEALLFDLKSHMSDLTTRAMLTQLSQSLT